MTSSVTQSEAVSRPNTEENIDVVNVTISSPTTKSSAVSSICFTSSTLSQISAVTITPPLPPAITSPVKVTTSCLENTLQFRNGKFPEKLHILACHGKIDFICWTPDGNSLLIHSQDYENLVMEQTPGFVRSPLFRNLRRQLKNYGFNVQVLGIGNMLFANDFINVVLEKWPNAVQRKVIYVATHPGFAQEMQNMTGISAKRKVAKYKKIRGKPLVEEEPSLTVSNKYKAICVKSRDLNKPNRLSNHTTTPIQVPNLMQRVTEADLSSSSSHVQQHQQNQVQTQQNPWQPIIHTGNVQPLSASSESRGLYTWANQNLGSGDVCMAGRNSQIQTQATYRLAEAVKPGYTDQMQVASGYSKVHQVEDSTHTKADGILANYPYGNTSGFPSAEGINYHSTGAGGVYITRVTNINGYFETASQLMYPLYQMALSPNTGAAYPLAHLPSYTQEQQGLDLSNFTPLSSSTPIKVKPKVKNHQEEMVGNVDLIRNGPYQYQLPAN